jgi:hypothetical protein
MRERCKKKRKKNKIIKNENERENRRNEIGNGERK